jgi:hypothetical protein
VASVDAEVRVAYLSRYRYIRSSNHWLALIDVHRAAAQSLGSDRLAGYKGPDRRS